MAYKIVVQTPAALDIKEYVGFLINSSKSAKIASNWLDGLEVVLESLCDMPTRHQLIEENDELEVPVRQIMYHLHRLVYTVNEERSTVNILRVYHSARRSLQQEDID